MTDASRVEIRTASIILGALLVITMSVLNATKVFGLDILPIMLVIYWV